MPRQATTRHPEVPRSVRAGDALGLVVNDATARSPSGMGSAQVHASPRWRFEVIPCQLHSAFDLSMLPLPACIARELEGPVLCRPSVHDSVRLDVAGIGRKPLATIKPATPAFVAHPAVLPAPVPIVVPGRHQYCSHSPARPLALDRRRPCVRVRQIADRLL